MMDLYRLKFLCSVQYLQQPLHVEYTPSGDQTFFRIQWPDGRIGWLVKKGKKWSIASTAIEVDVEKIGRLIEEYLPPDLQH